ncbi:MAG: hypothetical protein V1725_04350 [archaeon]
MKRKAIQLAGKTLLVSLPRAFVEKYHIQKGQDLFLSEEKDTIIVSGKGQAESKQATITADEGFDSRTISFLYQQGYDEITVQYSSSLAFQGIREKVEKLMGFEIVYQGEKLCVIKNISSEKEEAFDAIFERTWHIINNLAKDCKIALEQKECARLNDLSLLEDTINKLTDFCKRIINKHARSVYEYVVVRDLEKIGDALHRICTLDFKKEHKSLTKETMQYFTSTLALLQETQSLFFKQSDENLRSYLVKRDEHKKLYPTLNSITHELLVISEHLHEMHGSAMMLQQK